MERYPKVACAKAGCRQWAMRGKEFCVTHSRERLRQPARAAPEGSPEVNPGVESLYARYVTGEEQAFLLDAIHKVLEDSGAHRIEEELAVARLAVAKAIQLDKPEAIARTAMVVARLEQIKRQLEGEQATGLIEAVNQILAELHEK
jgi:hypothetical protein